jgi:hypothetical protein
LDSSETISALKFPPMDISTLNIPNLEIKRINGIEFAEAIVHLPAWDGYLTKRWENGREIADGTVTVLFCCNTGSKPEYWEEDVAAYHNLIEHQHATRDAIVAHVAANIPDLLGYLDPEELGLSHLIAASSSADIQPSAFSLPPSDGLRPFIGLQSVAIREDRKDGLAYIDWFLNCTWDEEHGLVAVTHGPRLIDLDRGEIDIYKIFADNGTLEEELKEAERYRNQPKPTPPKSWWKFW